MRNLKFSSLKTPIQFDYAGAAGGYIDRYGYPYCRGRIFERLETDQNQYTHRDCFFGQVEHVYLFAQPVWNELGGFDEDFFMHQEEIDLCWRAFNAGYKLNALLKCVRHHLGAASLKAFAEKTYLNHRNSLWMLIKNLPANQLFLLFFFVWFWMVLLGYVIY